MNTRISKVFSAIYFDHETCLKVTFWTNGGEVTELTGVIMALEGVKFSK
ncbi:hypothetical protein [Methanosarcina horonobensis]|nr:hypothetical protein [Methanosarcina horonobensis]